MATKSKRSKGRDTDSYLSLIQRLPLKPLRGDRDHEAAVAMARELMGQKLDNGAGDYLDTLILLVNKYEDENHAPMGEFRTPTELLKAIMNTNGLSQADMGKIIGSESAISMVLNGKRELSKSHIKLLSTRFGLDAGLFL